MTWTAKQRQSYNAAQSRIAKNTKPIKIKPRKVKMTPVQLYQEETTGAWLIHSESGRPIPATDFEVSLWLQLQETIRAMEVLR